jgi:autotransporter translocation and assembly factor TamB
MSANPEPKRRRKWLRRILATLVSLLLLAAIALGAYLMLNRGTPATSPSDDRGAVIDITVNPGTAEGFDGARADVNDVDCDLSQGRWSIAGSVTNPLAESVNYRIYTSFLDSDRKTVGLLQIDVEAVEPSATRRWNGSIDVSEPDLTCVLRVERTTSGP